MNRVQAARARRLGYAVVIAPADKLTTIAPASTEAQREAVKLACALRTAPAAMSFALLGLVAL